MNEEKATMAGNVVKTIVDLLITTLPLPLVLRTNMQRRQRYGVAVLFGLGYIVTGAGIVRTYFTWKVFNNKQGDQTWEEYPAFLGATVENNLAIVGHQLLMSTAVDADYLRYVLVHQQSDPYFPTSLAVQ
jgi:hypothetical protein